MNNPSSAERKLSLSHNLHNLVEIEPNRRNSQLVKFGRESNDEIDSGSDSHNDDGLTPLDDKIARDASSPKYGKYI